VNNQSRFSKYTQNGSKEPLSTYGLYSKQE
jgi:dynein heavy chain, axonemal